MSFAPGDGTRPVGIDELTSVEGAHASRRFPRRFARRCAGRFVRRFARRFATICSAIASAICSAILSAIFAGAFVPTASMQRDGAMLEPWLRRMEPLILVGPEGAGKNLLLSKLFAGQRGTQVENTTTRLVVVVVGDEWIAWVAETLGRCVPRMSRGRHDHNNDGMAITTTAWA